MKSGYQLSAISRQPALMAAIHDHSTEGNPADR
jgi:hypothetical protein